MFVEEFNLITDEEGHLTIALNNKKLTNRTGTPRNRGKRRTKIRRRDLFVLPAVQETVEAAVLFEFMKIRTRGCNGKRN
ncbi:hypothetical protein LIER_08608 [Lithospermum erythrorhizon]|uniref:Uncharacterized protein n=1 Tax=Lithospermum erythrorhizon TaxID=34254 RepID=A0AAV3PEQ0_LITER